MGTNKLGLMLEVSDLRPDATGDAVDFTLTARNMQGPQAKTGSLDLIGDISINVELSAGLEFTGNGVGVSGSRSATSRADPVDKDPDTSDIPQFQSTVIKTQLTSDSLEDIPLEERCITAWVEDSKPPPSPGYAFNRLKQCLGDQRVELFAASEVDAFKIYPCVGDTDAPCDSTDDVRVRAVTENIFGTVILEPEKAPVQVRDEPNRKYDSHANSVNPGTKVSWQTPVTWDASELNAVHALWSNFRDGFTVSGVNGGTPPGGVHIRAYEGETFEIIYKMTSATGWTAEDVVGYDPPATGNGPNEFTAEFEKLGTYKLQYTAKLTRTPLDGDENCDPNTATPPVNQRFCATETYTFHVGPIAELEVRDGAASQAPAETRAFTIAAVNNGPDAAPAAKVTLSDLDEDSCTGNATKGSLAFASGECTWTIGELKTKDVSQIQNGREGEILTIITSAAVDTEITAAISNTQDYQVCINSTGDDVVATTESACTGTTGNTWHSTEYYDYVSDNDSATVKAKEGTGEDLPSLRGALADTASIIVTWDAIDEVSGRGVTHYEVQRQTNPWETIADDVTGNTYVDTDVEAGDTFQYRIRAVNDWDHKGPWSQPIEGSVPVPETASAGPSNAPVLTASLPDGADGRTQIDLAWEKPVENGAPITSYTVEVSDSRNGPWAAPDPAPQLGRSDTSWSHTGLTGGTRKYYRMKATNSQGDSDWSEVIDATTRAPGKAGPPVNVRAAPDGDSAIDVSWDAPGDDGGSPIRYYEVQWSANGTSGWRNAGRTTDAETRTFKNTGMTFGTKRYYRVAARNGVTLGEWSDPPVSTTTLAGVPGMPNLTVRAKDANTIELSWTVPADNGSPIIRYELDQSPDGSDGSWSRLTTPAAADTSYDDTGLDPGTERHYRIRAVNGASPGEGSWSTVRKAVTPPAAPSAPTLRAVANGQNAIDLTWDPPADDGGADVSGYELHVSTDGSENSYSRLTSPSASARTYTHSRLQPGDTRHYQLRARNRAGLGEFSLPVSATTLTGVPDAPGLTARATAFDTVELSWTVPGDNGDPITGYSLEWSPDGTPDSWASLHTAGAADTSYEDTPLEPGTERHYRIRAVNSTGDGAWSVVRKVVTPPAPPVRPELRATPNGQNAIDLSWREPDNRGGPITSYELQVSTDGSENSYSRLTSPPASARFHTHGNLQPGDERYYQLRARNSAGWSEWSGEAFSFTYTGVPAAPNLTTEANGTTEIKLSWTKPDDRGLSIDRYEVQESDDGIGWDHLASGIPAGDRFYARGGLSAGTTKHYRVRALNGNGPGQWSQTRSARTDPGGPEAPVLTLSVISDTQIDLGWTVPADNGSSIRGYRVERSRDGNAPWERLADRHRTTGYNDDDLYRGTKRYYRVAATNRNGTGPFSAVVSATTTGEPAQPPGLPVLPHLSNVGRNQVTIMWDPPTDDGGAPVTGYEYEVARPCEDDPDTPDENESERNCGFGVDGGTATTGTSARISGLTTDGDYYFRVRAVNPIGEGEWTTEIPAILRPSMSGQVSVSPTTITVDEGGTVSYAVRLSSAPPHPVELFVQPRGVAGAGDLEDAAFAYTGSVLLPSGWTHPRGEDWSEFAYNWNQGVRVTFTAPEDEDALDDIAVMDHFVIAVPYGNYQPCSEEADEEQCKQDWEDDWESSPYRQLTGSSVKIIVRDND